MRFGPKPRLASCAAAAAALLGGCTSGSIWPAPAGIDAAASSVQSDARDARPAITCHPNYKLLFVSQSAAGTVDIYQNPQLIAPPAAPAAIITPSQGLLNPAGMTVANQVLFVANSGASDVLAFKLCGSGPGATYNDFGYTPVDVAYASGSNTLYASNSAPPSVTVFPNSLTYNPSLTLTDPNAAIGGGIALDSSGNCFWSFTDGSGGGHVDEFSACSQIGLTPLPLTPSLGTPNTVRMENHGSPNDRLIFENGSSDLTYIFHSPYAAPAAPSPWGIAGPVALGIGLNKPQNKLYVADATSGVVHRYKYPGGAIFFAPVSAGLSAAGGVTGVALSPPPP